MFDQIGISVKSPEKSRTVDDNTLCAFLLEPDGTNIEAACLGDV
jgi:hypothetical protein